MPTIVNRKKQRILINLDERRRISLEARGTAAIDPKDEKSAGVLKALDQGKITILPDAPSSPKAEKTEERKEDKKLSGKDFKENNIKE